MNKENIIQLHRGEYINWEEEQKKKFYWRKQVKRPNEPELLTWAKWSYWLNKRLLLSLNSAGYWISTRCGRFCWFHCSDFRRDQPYDETHPELRPNQTKISRLFVSRLVAASDLISANLHLMWTSGCYTGNKMAAYSTSRAVCPFVSRLNETPVGRFLSGLSNSTLRINICNCFVKKALITEKRGGRH